MYKKLRLIPFNDRKITTSSCKGNFLPPALIWKTLDAAHYPINENKLLWGYVYV